MKAFLKQIGNLDHVINIKLAQAQELRDMLTRITASVKEDAVQSSSAKDKLGDTVARIVDLENEANVYVDKLVDLKTEVIKDLQMLDYPYCEILFRRYIQYQKWEYIAAEMGYTLRHTTRLHGTALLKFEKIIDKNKKCP